MFVLGQVHSKGKTVV